MGVNEYLRTLRINHAVFLIDHGIDSVKNVALLSGFSDPLYFSAVFKKHIGMSPKEYRERNAAGVSEE
jgi:two-component system response regulator YesN